MRILTLHAGNEYLLDMVRELTKKDRPLATALTWPWNSALVYPLMQLPLLFSGSV
jgi:hypothetical protein